MSSLAAARADNFYYPPEFDPVKHKTLAKFTGQHPLRERAKKLDQGILVIRFEVPFHVWCNKCGEKIAKGERFNAEKKQVGNYHSTKIWQFSMTHHCGCKIMIETDPKNTEYIVTEGARQKVETYTAEAAGVISLADDEEKAKLASDPMYKLENLTEKKDKLKSSAVSLQDLVLSSEDKHRDWYSINKKLRSELRSAKKVDAALDSERRALNLPDSMKLLPKSEDDTYEAKLAFYDNNAKSRQAVAQRRNAILSESIFGGQKRGSGSGGAKVGKGLLGLAGGSSSGASGKNGTLKKSSSSIMAKAASLAKRQRMA